MIEIKQSGPLVSKSCIQGGMDPKILIEQDEKVLHTVDKYLEVFTTVHIFVLWTWNTAKNEPELIKKTNRES